MPKLKRRKGESKSQQYVRSEMTEMKKGELHSGSKTGPKVTNRKQAIAIGLSEARKAGAKAPAKKETVDQAKERIDKKQHRRKRNIGRS